MTVMVSVSCATYNQEGYIAQALDSFLMQETDFEFEILVHDDASTDGTAAIIKEYERAHPHIIKPIYQIENQYSKGVKVDFANAARALGKYIALCEGDDYWTDPRKLQRQVDLMESDPTCSLSVHSALKVLPEGAPVGEIRLANSDTTLCLDQLLFAEEPFFATSSMVFPARLYFEIPDYYFACPIGDVPLSLFLFSRGGVRYIDRQMSAYRVNAVGSWTRTIRGNHTMMIAHDRGMAAMYLAFDRSTGSTHREAVQRAIEKHDFRVALVEGNYVEVKHPKHSRLYKKLGWRSRMVVTLRLRSPRFAAFLARSKRSLLSLRDRRS